MNIYKLPDNPLDFRTIEIKDKCIYIFKEDVIYVIITKENNILYADVYDKKIVNYKGQNLNLSSVYDTFSEIDFKNLYKKHKEQDIIDYKFPENNMGFKSLAFMDFKYNRAQALCIYHDLSFVLCIEQIGENLSIHFI